jgi:hypothetical protein
MYTNININSIKVNHIWINAETDNPLFRKAKAELTKALNNFSEAWNSFSYYGYKKDTEKMMQYNIDCLVYEKEAYTLANVIEMAEKDINTIFAFIRRQEEKKAYNHYLEQCPEENPCHYDYNEI